MERNLTIGVAILIGWILNILKQVMLDGQGMKENSSRKYHQAELLNVISMLTIDLTEKDKEVIISALRDREARMFKDFEAYKKQDNQEAAFDCLHELRTAEHLRQRIQTN
jgi:hypothetical protein